MPPGPVDTRRVVRVPARCATTIAFGGGRWETTTDDLAAAGCQVTARLPMRSGEGVSVTLRFPGVPFALEVIGTVAWASAAKPYRTGIVFTRGQEEQATRFVRAVLAAAPALARSAEARGMPGLRAPPPPRRPPPLRRSPPRPGDAPSAPSMPGNRSPQAQALVEVARAERAAGRAHSAIHWLRAARQLAPDDEDIAAELGTLAFQKRDAGT